MNSTWGNPLVVTIIGGTIAGLFGLIALVIRLVLNRALAVAVDRIEAFHADAMRRMDCLTESVNAVRQTLTEHVRDHATGAFVGGQRGRE